jgi:hypothetical protein
MSERLNADELDEMETLYARSSRDNYLPVAVARRSAQIRALIEEVKMGRESAAERGNSPLFWR